MNFLHPEFLYLTPLLAVPVLIHLLNRIRYRVVRWAAIDFLLASERRAVRRARLRQILLMALRTLLLAAAVLALAQPIFRGGITALLGGSSQVAVIIDASASMSAADATGPAFDRAKKLVAGTLASLSGSTRAAAGTFAAAYNCPFREPLQNRQIVASFVDAASLTAGAGNVPRAIQAAAETLQHSGGGGSIWLLTDLQASGWQTHRSGAWQQVRQALEQAGSPRLIITDLAPKIESNLSITNVRLRPSILTKGDRPKLIATVVLHGDETTVTSVGLFLNDRQIDSRSVHLDAGGKVEVTFRLPAMENDTQAGYLKLSPDAVPADDRYYFVIRTTRRIPILLVDGRPSSIPFEGASDFLALALEPPEAQAMGRSLFSAETIRSEELPSTPLADYAAVFLADVTRLSDQASRQLRDFVSQGGLAIVFPGGHTDVAAWNKSDFPGVRIESILQAEDDKPMKVNWTLPNSPVVGNMPTEGLDQLRIRRLFQFAAETTSEVLATTDGGEPFLLRLQMGKGKAYVFAVSCQVDFSNLPFTPLLLLTVHRALLNHLVEHGEPLAREAFDELGFSLTGGSQSILTPDGQILALRPLEDRPGQAIFTRTELSGIYRLVQATTARDDDIGTAVAAINVPAEESILQRIDPQTVRSLLEGYSVSFTRPDGDIGELTSADTFRIARLSFPLAALALALLLGEVLLSWSIGRSAVNPPKPNEIGPNETKGNSSIRPAHSG